MRGKNGGGLHGTSGGGVEAGEREVELGGELEVVVARERGAEGEEQGEVPAAGCSGEERPVVGRRSTGERGWRPATVGDGEARAGAGAWARGRDAAGRGRGDGAQGERQGAAGSRKEVEVAAGSSGVWRGVGAGAWLRAW